MNERWEFYVLHPGHDELKPAWGGSSVSRDAAFLPAGREGLFPHIEFVAVTDDLVIRFNTDVLQVFVAEVSNIKPVPGQLPALFEEPPPEVELPYIGPGIEREEVAGRAGTPLDHRWTHPIEGYGRKGTIQHGLYDERQRIYQTGGELSNFVFWKTRDVTIALDAWKQVWQKVDWIEVIDHERNECWRIAMKRAFHHAHRYSAGIGPRIGIPMKHWDIITSRGTLRQEGEP